MTVLAYCNKTTCMEGDETFQPGAVVEIRHGAERGSE